MMPTHKRLATGLSPDERATKKVPSYDQPSPVHSNRLSSSVNSAVTNHYLDVDSTKKKAATADASILQNAQLVSGSNANDGDSSPVSDQDNETNCLSFSETHQIAADSENGLRVSVRRNCTRVMDPSRPLVKPDRSKLTLGQRDGLDAGPVQGKMASTCDSADVTNNVGTKDGGAEYSKTPEVVDETPGHGNSVNASNVDDSPVDATVEAMVDETSVHGHPKVLGIPNREQEKDSPLDKRSTQISNDETIDERDIATAKTSNQKIRSLRQARKTSFIPTSIKDWKCESGIPKVSSDERACLVDSLYMILKYYENKGINKIPVSDSGLSSRNAFAKDFYAYVKKDRTENCSIADANKYLRNFHGLHLKSLADKSLVNTWKQTKGLFILALDLMITAIDGSEYHEKHSVVYFAPEKQLKHNTGGVKGIKEEDYTESEGPRTVTDSEGKTKTINDWRFRPSQTAAKVLNSFLTSTVNSGFKIKATVRAVYKMVESANVKK